MSIILDALKKSEAERQRQAGPALMEVRVVPPQRRFPWGWLALGLLLGGNLWLLLWLLLRSPAPAAVAPTPAVAAVPAAAPVAAPIAAAPSSVAPAIVAPTPAATVPQEPAYVASQANAGTAIAGHVVEEPEPDINPADLAPAINNPRSSGPVRSYADVAGSVPELRLDLHVYAEKPADRYALVNMHKVREGDTLPEGPKVSEITRDGVIMRYQGTDFLLSRE